MTEYDILKELEKLNDDDNDDDFDAGFLRELQHQAPDELHLRIMNSIREEAQKLDKLNETPKIRTRNRFNYRKYASYAAAAAVIMVAFIGGAQSILEKKLSPVDLSQKTPVVFTIKDDGNKAEAKTTTNSVKTTSIDVGTNKLKSTNDSSGITPSKSINLLSNRSASASSEVKTQKAQVTPKKKEAPKVSANTLRTSITSADISVTISDKDHNFDVDPSETAKGTGSNNNPTNKNTADTNENKAQIKPDTTATNNGDKPNTNEEPNPNLMIAANDNLVNYEIELNMGQNYNIIQFIREKGTKVSDSNIIYKLEKADFDALSQLLEQNGIAENKINDTTDTSVVVKMNIN
jgi:hypothetical protein